MSDRTFATGRGSVNMAECDQWGHMNVQFYLARATDAQAHLAARIGLLPSRLRKEALSLRPLADRTLFKRELRGGDIHMIRSGIRAVHPEGTIDIASRMTNLVTGVESAAFETRLALMGPDDDARSLPDDVLSAALDLAGDLPGMPPPPPMAAVQPLGAPPLDRMLLTYRGSIEPWDCDSDGVAPPRAHIARFNDAITHLFRAMALDRKALLAEGTGSAALDYDIAYRRPLRAGTAVEVRSGVLAVGEKVYHIIHHVVDSNEGFIYTSIVVAALFFDLQRRKSVPMPASIRTAAQRLIAHA
jgi:acyl-CoA thioester hydrolase